MSKESKTQNTRQKRRNSNRLRIGGYLLLILEGIFCTRSFSIDPLWDMSQISAGKVRCIDLLEGEAYADNATHPTRSYKETTWRTLEEIKKYLGPRFENSLDALPNGAAILLPGGGFGLYGIQLAQLGHHTIVINPQKFFAELLPDLYQDPIAVVWTEDNDKIFSVRGLRVNVINRLAHIFNIPLPACLTDASAPQFEQARTELWELKPGSHENTLAKQLKTFRESLKQHFPKRFDAETIYTHVSGGTMVFYDTTAQQILYPIDRHNFDLVIDHLDAVFYSSDRLALVMNIQKTLKPNAKAYVVISSLYDVVELSQNSSLELFEPLLTARKKLEGSKVFLWEYLTGVYPKYFDTYHHLYQEGSQPATVLEITGSQEALSELPLETHPQILIRDYGIDAHIPIVYYSETN